MSSVGHAPAAVEITGELRSAHKSPCEGGLGFVLMGCVYGDTKGRFRDGDYIHTSYVVRELEGDVFVTRNNAYRVAEWAPGVLSKSQGG